MLPLKPLPDCEGPKLEPYTQDLTAHDFDFLDVPRFHWAVHSIIAKVKIDGWVYCLKLFFPAGPDSMPGFFEKDCRPQDSPALQKLISDHNDPFNCECRAFGRLKEVGREDIAVRAYGYISLPLTKDILKNMHRAMEKYGAWKDWDWEDGRVWTSDPREILGDQDGPDDGSWCVMGILKDWIGPVDGGPPPTPYEEGLVQLRLPSMFRRMLASVKALHRYGIVVCDVKSDQWVDGTLVDLSCAMTTPHMSGPGGVAGRPSWTFASVAAWDLLCFQTQVIDDWNDTDWSWFTNITPPTRKCRFRAYRVPDEIKLELEQKQQDWLERQERRLQQRPRTATPSSQGGEPPQAKPPEATTVQPPRRIRDDLRPRPKQHGPFLPLLNNHYYENIDPVELPPYDPAKFDWRAVAVAKTPPRRTDLSGRRGGKMNKRRADAKTKIL